MQLVLQARKVKLGQRALKVRLARLVTLGQPVLQVLQVPQARRVQQAQQAQHQLSQAQPVLLVQLAHR